MRTLVLLLACAAIAPGQKAPFTVDAMMKLARISEPQISPDGKNVVFTVETEDVEKNAKPKHIYIVPVAGGMPTKLTSEGNNERPRWMPNSNQIVFISDRAGTSQIWMMNSDGTAVKQITNLATEASGVTVAPSGKYLVFTSEVYPDCTDETCNTQRVQADKKSVVQARVINSLLYRHWKTWQSKRRSHLLAVPANGGPSKDLTPGPVDVPTFSLGGPDDYVISPDGSEVAYVANLDPVQATSTNTDIFVVPMAGGESKRITTGPGGDRSPLYSPDGKFLAFRSQARGGYESDRWRLIVLERATGAVTVLNESQDRPVESMAWSPDSTRIFYVIEDRGRNSIQFVPTKGGGARVAVSGDSHLDNVQFAPDGKTMLYSANSATRPPEIYRASSGGGAPEALTRLNDAVLNGYSLPPMEDFSVEAKDQARINSFLVKPPDFSPNRKYPVVFLIHGGPQGAWGQSWSFRWNPQVFAAAGYVVVLPNPRGSTGYGQKFTDEINLDWGGKPFEDIMAVADYVAAQPWADPDRFAAAGGSYGGYMVDWMLGHTQRFKALVSHAGVYDLRSMFGETEETWFPLWDFQGMPWTNPDVYQKWSPSMFVTDFKTPTLVTHGELDYRVPVGQGMQLFTALQLQKVPSKMVLFPDEGHWILKPANSILWYNSVLDWIGEWTKKKS